MGLASWIMMGILIMIIDLILSLLFYDKVLRVKFVVVAVVDVAISVW